MSCVGFVWCVPHRLKLARQDALSEWMSPVATKKSREKSQELNELNEMWKCVYLVENNKVKRHSATGTRWIAHELMALNNFIDKCRLYDQHMDNIIADI